MDGMEQSLSGRLLLGGVGVTAEQVFWRLKPSMLAEVAEPPYPTIRKNPVRQGPRYKLRRDTSLANQIGPADMVNELLDSGITVAVHVPHTTHIA